MQRRSGKLRIGSLLLMSAVILVVVIGVIWIFGRVTGEEFSPQRFMIRRFAYWQIPMLKVQVLPVSFVKLTGNNDRLAKHIRMNNLHGSIASSPSTWDIVSLEGMGRTPYQGDAQILAGYLKQTDPVGLESLFDWTCDNPKEAKVIWSLVALLAQHDLYAVIPDLIDAARQSKPDELKTELAKIVARDCVQLSKAEKDLGNVKKSNQILSLVAQVEAGDLESWLEEVDEDDEDEDDEDDAKVNGGEEAEVLPSDSNL